jgi:type IV pilus assembly protein PilB
MNLLATLAERNIIGKDEVAAIEEESNADGSSIESILLKRGIDSELLLKIKSEQYDIPTFSLGEKAVSGDVLAYIPEESATHYQIVPLGVVDGVLEVGITDPDNIEALDALNFISTKVDLPFKAYLITEHDFQRVLQMYKGLSGEVNKALTELESELVTEEDGEDGKKEKRIQLNDEPGVIKEDAPVTKIVANILRYAVDGGASDVHIEHTGEAVRVRFRIDGVLHTNLTLPAKIHSAIVARIKILSSMKLDEKRKPQDGRFSATVSGRKVDFRVSTFPTYYGEKVVMRILDTEKGIKGLEETGLSKQHMELIREAIKRPYGMILISGPTGSGKTTTLYGMVKELDRDTQNVLSLEDPVEYSIGGLNQSQVHPEIGYTFANGLRTTLRQDPDIIMVGEIRDKETAQLAVQAALTGHLVLSTIHTNNAIGVIPRLVDMGVDPYLIAPTLNLAIAQRLVRKLCPDARRAIPVEGSIGMMIEKEFETLPDKYKTELLGDFKKKSVYEISPTKECPTGTRGRLGVFEMLPMTRELESVVLKKPVESDIEAIARKTGMITMKEDAILKALDGAIPFSEVSTLGREFLSEEE